MNCIQWNSNRNKIKYNEFIKTEAVVQVVWVSVCDSMYEITLCLKKRPTLKRYSSKL